MTDHHKTWLTWFQIGTLTAKGSGVTGWKRMHVLPRNRLFNIYLHRYDVGFEDSREYGLHDHPWWSVSIRLWGKIRETYMYDPMCSSHTRTRRVPRVCFRPARHAHALEVSEHGPACTLFITGPRVRKWGFYTKIGWQAAEWLE